MQLYQTNIVNQFGNAESGVTVTVYMKGSTTVSPVIYSDNGVTPISAVLTSGAGGLISFYCGNGQYDLVTTATTNVPASTKTISLMDFGQPATDNAPSGGALIGTTTNDSAGTGLVGEYQSPAVVPATTVSLSTGTPVTVTSISLTAGDWDVQGGAIFATAASTSVTQVLAGISTTNNTLGADGTYARATFAAVVPGAVEWQDQVTPIVRISIAATTTVYVVAQSTFTVSTQTAGGYIRARRVR